MLALMLAASLLSLLAPPARAQQAQEETPDADCPGPAKGNFQGGRSYAQTFTAENNGGLTRVQLDIMLNSEGQDFVVEIRAVDDSGAPTGTVLASAEVNDVPATRFDPRTITANFDPGATVLAGQQYALAITDTSNQSFAVPIHDDNPCPGGNLFTDQNATGSFGSQGGMDLIFATFVKVSPIMQFEIADFVMGKEGDNAATIQVVRQDGSDGEVEVDYATSDGTASAGSYYTAASDTLTFGPGETRKSFPIQVANDATDEEDEKENLTLSNPQGGVTLGAQSEATLTIPDDDEPPTISVGERDAQGGQLRYQERLLPRYPLAGERQDRHVRLRDGRRHGQGRLRLHREERHAHLRAGRD